MDLNIIDCKFILSKSDEQIELKLLPFKQLITHENIRLKIIIY